VRVGEKLKKPSFLKKLGFWLLPDAAQANIEESGCLNQQDLRSQAD
jgi:hypothetical protein